MGKRMGKFMLSDSMYFDRNYGDEVIWQILERLQFVPYHVEMLAYSRMMELIGSSPMFDVLPDSHVTPEYSIRAEFVKGENPGDAETLLDLRVERLS